MRIRRWGREYVYWPVSGVPFDAADLELSFDDGVTWHTAEWNDLKDSARLFVGGPESDPGPQIVLGIGRHDVIARLADTPEVIIRDSDAQIEVK